MNTKEETTSNKFALYISIGKILAMMAQFVMPLFLTRFLTKGDYGIYSQFYLLLSFLGTIFCFGIPTSLYYFYPRLENQNKRNLIWNTLIATIILGLFASLFLLIPPINRLLINNVQLSSYIYLIIGCLIFFIPSNLVAPITTIRKDKITTIFFPPIDILLKIILVISFALIFKTLGSIFTAIFILQFCIFLYIIVYIYYHYPIRKNQSFISWSLLKQQLSYSLPFGFSVILNSICQQIDRIICISFLSTEEFAIYSLAFFGIPGIRQIYDSICQVNVINMASAHQQNNPTKVLNLYKNFVVQTLSFSLPIIIIVFIFTPQIITTLFSEKYIDSIPFFRIYILTFVIAMIGGGTILRAIGKTKYSLKSYVYSTIICVPITYFLISQFGIWGAITSATINAIIPRIFQITSEIKQMNAKLSDYFPWKSIFNIILISTSIAIPIIITASLYYISNIFLCLFITIAYLTITYSLEIKYNIFLIDKKTVLNKLNFLYKKIKI